MNQRFLAKATAPTIYSPKQLWLGVRILFLLILLVLSPILPSRAAGTVNLLVSTEAANALKVNNQVSSRYNAGNVTHLNQVLASNSSLNTVQPDVSDQIAFSTNIYTVTEGTSATITATRTGSGLGAMLARIPTTDVSTVVASDYTSVAGALDTGFNTGPNPGVNNAIYGLVLQPDGKIVIGGAYSQARGVTQNGIARLNPDGSLDTGFNTDDPVGTDNTVLAVALQSDGKIIIGGIFSQARGINENGIARLNPDGSVDTSFNTGADIGANGGINVIVVQPTDGKIIIGGNFTNVRGVDQNYIARLNSDGSLDTSFNTGADIGADMQVSSLALQTDGKILVGGSFTLMRGATQNHIARLNPDGSLDTNFNTGANLGTNGQVLAITLLNNGQLLIGGNFTSVRGVTQNYVTRLNSDGSLDSSFTAGTNLNLNNAVNTIVVQPNNKIVIGGLFTQAAGGLRRSIARLNPNGSIDPSFNSGPASSGTSGGTYVVALQPDAKVINGGFYVSSRGVPQGDISRLFGDYTVSWADGETGPKTIGIPIVADGIPEPQETATLGLEIITGTATISTPATATLVIAGHLNTTPNLTSTPNPSTFGQSVTFTATVALTATGTITFREGITDWVTVPIVNGVATYVTNTLSVGNHIVKAVYSGDINYLSSTSANYNHNVTKASTTFALISDPNPSIFGQSVTFTATVTPITATGTVTFIEGITALGTGTLSGGVAIFVTNSLSVGSHNIKATYGGDSSYTGSTSNTLTQVVNKLSTTLTLTSTPNPSIFGQSVTFTATVSPMVASGTVTFTEGLNTLGTATLSGGVATFVTNTLPAGSHAISATYGGDNSYAGSSSNTVTQLVSQATTTLTLTSAPNPSAFGQSVTFTATISPITASGTVTFTEGATTLGTGTLASGVATFSTSGLPVGSHVISATYGGDSSYSGSSNTVTQTVNQASTSLTLTSAPNPSIFGQSVTFTATVAPITATGTVTFTGGLATLGTGTLSGGVATFVTSTLLVGSHTITATYGGDNSYLGSSNVVTQVVNADCDPLVVTNITDDGAASACGTFSYALVHSSSGVTITFMLTTSNMITFTGQLTPTVKSGVIINGGNGACGIVLYGNNVPGDGLRLEGQDTLINLTIRKFAGRELVTLGPGNILKHVVIQQT